MADWSIYTSELIYAYVHGHPFVGGGSGVHHSVADMADAAKFEHALVGPGPGPWQTTELTVAASLMSAAALKAALSAVPEGSQSSSMMNALDARIDSLIDEYCGTPPHSPWPGPWANGYGLAAGISFLAGTLAQSGLREAVADVATRLVTRIVRSATAFDGTAGGPPTGGGAHGPGHRD